MAKTGFLICLMVVAMDIVAGILGIEAEKAQEQVRGSRRLQPLECGDTSQEAFKLGLAAVVLLALAHVTANLLAGCACISSTQELERSSANRFTVAIGFPMLIIGTLANSKSRDSIAILHRHLLSIGGILCFVHGLFCIAYYISVTISNGD